MSIGRRGFLKFVSTAAAALATTGLRGRRAFADGRDVIERDVCVLGGGSSGTFSAIRLRDAGTSVVILERNQRLGGHTETYRDPATGIPTDYGVIVFHDLPVVTDYFAHLGVRYIPVAPSVLFTGPIAYFDFRTGTRVDGYAPPPQTEVAQALGSYFGYLQQLKFTYYDLDRGFDLPQPVPPDLLLPFGEFVQRHKLAPMVNTVFGYGQGLGDLLRMPSVYVLKNFSAQVLTSIFGDRFLLSPNGNAEIYERALRSLGDDVVLGADVARVERDARGVIVYVDTPDGPRRIRCKQLLITCPPTLDNLRVLDLDPQEASTFSHFRSNFYWTGLLELSGVPAGLSIENIGLRTLYNLPPLPGIYQLSPSLIPGIWNVKYGSPTRLRDGDVKRMIVEDVERLRDRATFSGRPRVVDFTVFSAHNPFELWVSSDDIADGFYTQLGSLQGRNHTFYTGAAFHTHDSGLLWQFSNDHVLPMMLAQQRR